MKKVVALILLVMMIFTIAACQTTQTQQPVQTNIPSQQTAPEETVGSGRLFSEPVKISMMIASHASWPYQEDWKVWEYIKEATGVDLEITAVPNEGWTEKINLAIASRDSLPDIIHLWNKTHINNHALSGAFVNVMDHAGNAPNFRKWMETYPNAEDILTTSKAGDGNVYWFPSSGTETTTNIRGWMYRKDIFDKHSLVPPLNDTQMYETAKELKSLYPQSYPIANRDGINKYDMIATQWGTYLYGYYDFDKDQWRYGAIEDNFKDMVSYYLKLYQEELMPPDFLTLKAQGWVQLMSTDKGFITNDYLVRKDGIEGPARKENPEFTLELMAPPIGGANGIAKLPKTNVTFIGFSLFNTGDKNRIDNAVKFIDWYYTDEAIELTSWGKEGETYEVADGKKRFILDDSGQQPINLYGFVSYGAYLVVDPVSREMTYTPDNVRIMREQLDKYSLKEFNPTTWLSYSESQQEVISQIGTTIDTHMLEQIAKFMTGQRPISEWDIYVNEIKSLGVDKLLKTYEEAYNAVRNTN